MAHIPREQLEAMFRGMRAEADWDTDRDLLWGYFFTDPNPERLKPLASQLVEQGYGFVSIYETDDKSTYFLHVEREETHTPESLFERNRQLNTLAEEFAIESYDGMDVGPVAGGTQ
jgi:hypothetical protein